jgi:hypothetical protein
MAVLSAQGVSGPAVAKAFGVSLNAVDKWKMAGMPDRLPPEGWERVLADLCEREADAGVTRAEERGEVLQGQADLLYAASKNGAHA